MKKVDAIKLFDSGAGLARAVGLTRGRISQWPDELSQKQADLVMGAAVRLGRIPATGMAVGESDEVPAPCPQGISEEAWAGYPRAPGVTA